MTQKVKFKLRIAEYIKSRYADRITSDYIAGAITGGEYIREQLLNEFFDWYNRNVLSSNYTPTLNDLRNDFKLDD